MWHCAGPGFEHLPTGRREDGGELVALADGCVCCSLRGDLVRAVAGLAAQHRFDHVLIEATGARPGSRLRVQRVSWGQPIPGSVTLVLGGSPSCW